MNLAEAYGRLAEQAERTSGAALAHPLHGLWTKADAGNSVDVMARTVGRRP